MSIAESASNQSRARLTPRSRSLWLAPLAAVDSPCRCCNSDEIPCQVQRRGPERKVVEMRKVAFALIGALFAVLAGTSSASASRITDVEPHHGGVIVTALGGTILEETITTGQLAEEGPGLCADGLIHSSCTPANE